MVAAGDLPALEARLRAVEDELEIRRLILSYGPAADAGMAALAASVWQEDGLYDWDANGDPHVGRAGVEAMLLTDAHQGLTKAGVAHFAGPPLIQIDGDTAVAITYSLIMRRDAENDAFYLWRVSAVRWDLGRADGSWGVTRRTNRLLDDTAAGRELFGATLKDTRGADAR
ncbi:nuclear transport factor 2 family protein [Frankia sp. R82]|uniref:nuclear transport factor 2 family protein n=1 Tax=Frankia sp. R82 TaxID=2950553 RepID=UPI002042E95A|nr:nuclear transport factor 2 family protein [Frankia sp. R82]MCM3882165.1 nuclear transport factor 2 family protein [Frankia sp. R82]